MSRPHRTALLLGALPLLLGACATDPVERSDQGDQPFAVNVDIDTPQLRAIKKEAGVEPCRPGGAAAAPAEGMPDLVLSCLGGGPDVNLSSLSGPLVLNLWASWCGPCREELPYYQRLHEAAGDTVQVLGIDFQDTQPEAALELIRETGVTFPQLTDPAGDIRMPFGVRGLPGVVLVDEQGSITQIEFVAIDSYEQLRDLVEKHLDVSLS